MRKDFKIIFILVSLMILSGVLLFSNTAKAQSAPPLKVTWSDTPLFTVNNFLPGNTANTNKWFKVKNNGSESKAVGFFVTVTKRGDLLNVLKANIKFDDAEFSSVFSSIEGYLEYGGNFIGTGSNTDINNYLTLTTLEPGAEKQFFLSIDFDSTAGNEYQGKSVTVDFVVGFLGSPPPPVGEKGRIDISYAYPSGKVVDKIADETILLKNIGDEKLDEGTLTLTLPKDYLLLDSTTPNWRSYDSDIGEVQWDIPELLVDETYLIKFSVKPIKSGTGIISSINYKGSIELTVYGEENIGRVAGAIIGPSEETIPQKIGRVLGAATGSPVFLIILMSVVLALTFHLFNVKKAKS